ncbi:Wall-associated protein precursor [Archangium violaceum]|uniref:Wall-associated protein precursor n=1 Tax=Archangium violaceum TaxID=83451 RepID=UPI002B2C9CB8|nr:Wall-associated protein precursor [Archangium gephyra]
MSLLPLILVLVTTQIPCGPREFSDTCKCKQGMATACEALRQTDKKLADALEAAARQEARRVVEAAHAQQGAEESGASESEVEEATQASSDSPEPPECKGQNHHVISKRIARALKAHPVLRGLYKARDERFVARAKDEESHCGYQRWHRDVDDEVVAWLRKTEDATREQFEAFLREIYSRPDMLARFPNGYGVL